MNKKKIIKFIYWNIMPIIILVVTWYYINKTADKISDSFDTFQLLILYFMLGSLFGIIHTWIGHDIFKERTTLADKIMNCKLRKQYGSNYCVKCNDSYACASTVDNK